MALEYKNLVVWQRADDLFIEVHRLTHQQFPASERFELGGQMRRAGFSVPSNIVEGNARYSTRDKLRFFNVAAASLSELTYGLHAAHRLEYIDDAEYKRLDDLARMVAAPLYGLIRRQRRQAAANASALIDLAIIVALRFLS